MDKFDTGLFSCPMAKNVYYIKGLLELHTPEPAVPMYRPPCDARIWVDGIEVIPEFAYELRPFYGNVFGWARVQDEMKRCLSLALCRYFFKDEPIDKSLALYRVFTNVFIESWPETDIALVIDLGEFLYKYSGLYKPNHSWHFSEYALNMGDELEVSYDPLTKLYTLPLARQYAAGYTSVIADETCRREQYRRKFRKFSFFAGSRSFLASSSLKNLLEDADYLLKRFEEMQMEGETRKLDDY